MLSAVIVDDELDAIEAIKLILKEHFPDINVLGYAQHVTDARNLIISEKPDIVFLDIEMPSGTGFDVLEGIPERNFNVIFVTAYNQYALKAFKYSATDYILKPIDIDDLVRAIKKIELQLGRPGIAEAKIDNLLQNIQAEKPEKIALSTSESIEFVKIDNIVQIQGEGNYSTLKMLDQTELVVSKNIGEFEDLLSDYMFFRPHQSHLINLKHVKKVNRYGNEIVMEDSSIAFLSRRKKNAFLDLMLSMVQKKKD